MPERERIETKEFARELRSKPNNAERIMWRCLRSSATGFKFRRQMPIGPYIADFCCTSHKVIVELDGISHQGSDAYDRARDEWLATQGFAVVRIHNSELIADAVRVVKRITETCEGRPQHRY